MNKKIISLSCLLILFSTGCANRLLEQSDSEKIESFVPIVRLDRGVESAFRALPTKIDSARQPAHYQHVYVDSISDSAVSLKTIPLSDAVANDLLASSLHPVRKLDFDADKLQWVVLDRGQAKPSSIEAVGGAMVGVGNLSEVNFNLNEVEIINKERLDQLIKKAQKVSGTFYAVAYADESGIEAKNYLLSQERASAVSEYLISNGINASRINFFGAGISNLYPGLDKNRRASVSFLIEEPQK